MCWCWCGDVQSTDASVCDIEIGGLCGSAFSGIAKSLGGECGQRPVKSAKGTHSY
jgi:hypothetical protein